MAPMSDGNMVPNLERTYKISPKPAIDVGFVYDSTVGGIKAAK